MINDPTYFFGRENFDWATVILEMFSHKLDKLEITSEPFREFLNPEAIASLKEVSQLLKIRCNV